MCRLYIARYCSVSFTFCQSLFLILDMCATSKYHSIFLCFFSFLLFFCAFKLLCLFAANRMETIVPVFRLWTLGLHSASMSFKLLAFKALSELINSCRAAFLSLPLPSLPPALLTSSVPILPSLPLVSMDKGVKVVTSEMASTVVKSSTGSVDASDQSNPSTQSKNISSIDSSSRTSGLNISSSVDIHPHINRTALLNVLETCLSMLPVPRLRATAAKRLWHEIEDFPSYSRYLQVQCVTLLQMTAHYD